MHSRPSSNISEALILSWLFVSSDMPNWGEGNALYESLSPTGSVDSSARSKMNPKFINDILPSEHRNCDL